MKREGVIVTTGRSFIGTLLIKKLEIVGEPHKSRVGGGGEQVGWGDFEAAKLRAVISVGNIESEGELEVLADIPIGARLDYPGRIVKIVDDRNEDIEQRVQLDLDGSAADSGTAAQNTF